MSPADALAGPLQWYLARPVHTRILLAFAISVLVIELLFRRVAPRSRAYAAWTSFFQAVGKVWTAVILSVVYFLSVAAAALLVRLLGKDLLDRRLGTGVSAWHVHEPNPLGPRAASRHQF